MPLPVLHSFAGYSLYRVSRGDEPRDLKVALLCVTLANLADFDFLPGLFLGGSEIFHRGISHSLGAAILVAALAAVVSGGIRKFFLFFLAYASHLLLDSFNGPGTAMPLLWPLSSVRYAMPFSLSFGNSGMHTAGELHEFADSLVSWVALERLFFEMSLVSMIVVWVRVGKQATASVRLNTLAPKMILGLLLFAVCIALE